MDCMICGDKDATPQHDDACMRADRLADLAATVAAGIYASNGATNADYVATTAVQCAAIIQQRARESVRKDIASKQG